MAHCSACAMSTFDPRPRAILADWLQGWAVAAGDVERERERERERETERKRARGLRPAPSVKRPSWPVASKFPLAVSRAYVVR